MEGLEDAVEVFSDASKVASELSEAGRVEEAGSDLLNLSKALQDSGELEKLSTETATVLKGLLNVGEETEGAAMGIEASAREAAFKDAMSKLPEEQNKLIRGIIDGERIGDDTERLESFEASMKQIERLEAETQDAEGTLSKLDELEDLGENPPSSNAASTLADDAAGGAGRTGTGVAEGAEESGEATSAIDEAIEEGGGEVEELEDVGNAGQKAGDKIVKKIPKMKIFKGLFVGAVTTILVLGIFKNAVNTIFCEECPCDEDCNCCQPRAAVNNEECHKRIAPTDPNEEDTCQIPSSLPNVRVQALQARQDKDDLCTFKKSGVKPRIPPPDVIKCTFLGGGNSLAGLGGDLLQPLQQALDDFVKWVEQAEQKTLDAIEQIFSIVGTVLLPLLGIYITYKILRFAWGLFGESSSDGDSSARDSGEYYESGPTRSSESRRSSGSNNAGKGGILINFNSYLSEMFSNPKKSTTNSRSKKSSASKKASESALESASESSSSESSTKKDLRQTISGGGSQNKVMITLLLFVGYLLFYLYERYTLMIKQREKLKGYYQVN